MSTRPQGGVPAHAATSTSLAVLEVEHFVARTEAEPSSPVYLHVAQSTLRTCPARDPRCLPHIRGPSSALRSLFVPRIKHDEPGRVNQELNLRRSAVRWRLSGFLGLLEPDRKSVSVKTILKPSWPVDQCSGDPLQPKFEERALVDFEQPIGDVNSVNRVGPIRCASHAA